ncbi:type II toxin-antitoxin system Phd/YefM family antitoxin [Piscinibacter sakaiensis]|uniref:type II toxin-antitoxin system Phd/YefM family antitoxin n=1 Tax=Piscinibacter sakaiensis TaxID=1547922 RepID=UPI003AAA9824
MDAISCSAAKASLAKTMDRVCEDREPIVITRHRGQSVVLLSLDEFKAMQETAHLLRRPANAWRLLSAAVQLAEEKGRT